MPGIDSLRVAVDEQEDTLSAVSPDKRFRAAFATPVVILLALDLQSSLLARQALLKEGNRALLIHHISHLGRLLFACWILRILAMELRIDGDCKERLPDFLIRFRICC